MIQKTPQNFLNQKWKRLKKIFLNLKKVFISQKNYHDYDDNEYIGIRDVRSLFDQSSDKDYYKSIKTIGSFDNKNNYIECESKGDKDKKLSPTEYLNMIRPYLSDIINDHKAHEGWVENKVIDYKTITNLLTT